MSAYGFRSSGILAPTVYKSTSNNEVIFVTFELRSDVGFSFWSMIACDSLKIVYFSITSYIVAEIGLYEIELRSETVETFMYLYLRYL